MAYTAKYKKGDTVFYKTGADTVRASVKTVHRDGSVTITALFYQRDGKDAPGCLGFTYRMDAADLVQP